MMECWDKGWDTSQVVAVVVVVAGTGDRRRYIEYKLDCSACQLIMNVGSCFNINNIDYRALTNWLLYHHNIHLSSD